MKLSVVAVFLLLAGCSAGAPATPSPAAATPTAVATAPPTASPVSTPVTTPAPTPAQTPLATSTAGYSCDPDMTYGCNASPSPGTSGAPSAVVIALSSGASPHFLDPNGNALYTFDNDTTTTSACASGCTDTWPPLVVQPGYTLQAGGHEEDFATITRSDGSLQLTYYGKPLYSYAGDASATDINGDGLFGKWHLAVVQP